jgi:hypothetical protein
LQINMKKSMALKFTPGSCINFGSLQFTADQAGDLILLEHEHQETIDQAALRLPATLVQGLRVTDEKPGHVVASSAEYKPDSTRPPGSYSKSDLICNTAADSESDSEGYHMVYMADGASD